MENKKTYGFVKKDQYSATFIAKTRYLKINLKDGSFVVRNRNSQRNLWITQMDLYWYHKAMKFLKENNEIL